MNPTYKSGQIVLATRLRSDIQRGQAVVFRQDGETMVKRVAFLPGDRIEEFKYLGDWFVPPNDFALARMKSRGVPSRYLTVPPDHLYVLGDNFEGSVDSRTFGPIPDSCVLGEVLGAPQPDRIHGFAGVAEHVDGGTRVTYRKLPLSHALLSKVKLADRVGVD